MDGATSNGINMAAVVTEKLKLPSTDANVAANLSADPDLPAHRKWSVVAIRDPNAGKVAVFVIRAGLSGL